MVNCKKKNEADDFRKLEMLSDIAASSRIGEEPR